MQILLKSGRNIGHFTCRPKWALLLLGYDTVDTNKHSEERKAPFWEAEVREAELPPKEHYRVTTLINMPTICLNSTKVETTALIKAQYKHSASHWRLLMTFLGLVLNTDVYWWHF